jgi:hypothetical protein
VTLITLRSLYAQGHLTRTHKKTKHQRNTETAAFQKRYEEENINDVTERLVRSALDSLQKCYLKMTLYDHILITFYIFNDHCMD